jgi:hypothetical protein
VSAKGDGFEQEVRTFVASVAKIVMCEKNFWPRLVALNSRPPALYLLWAESFRDTTVKSACALFKNLIVLVWTRVPKSFSLERFQPLTIKVPVL